ncbi:unnamed protein product [Mesocestoides corti]|uniref:Uncharacterized protein n=1 Tax=Mesocestoides corti TaxID=53468 RepID=A0A0R3URH2_MESCO|nr:unnamed protein product [Mesocestoides corti]
MELLSITWFHRYRASLLRDESTLRHDAWRRRNLRDHLIEVNTDEEPALSAVLFDMWEPRDALNLDWHCVVAYPCRCLKVVVVVLECSSS